MPFTLTMPKLSPTMDEGTIVKWHKNAGDAIQVGDVLMEVATDKATVEYTALDEGYLRQILIKEGEEASVNQPIAILTVEKNENLEGYQAVAVKVDNSLAQTTEQITEKDVSPEQQLPSDSSEDTSKKKKYENRAQPQFIPEEPLTSQPYQKFNSCSEKRIVASPLAKKIAKEKGLDLTNVRGTGPNHRIMSKDLAYAPPLNMINFQQQSNPLLPAGSYEEEALSPLRKIIGQRLQEAKSFIPHFYITQIVDAENLVNLREQLKAHDIKFSINDFIVRACALALRQHPTINRGFNSVNQTIIQFKTVDIAIAVSLENGLITPIVRHADYKSIQEISLEIRQLAERAKQGKLENHEYKGGSFTISNLGMYGISEFQAILNPPQAAILAVSSIQDVPVIRQNKIEIGKTLNLTLSVDHRVIDGALAAVFLQTLKKIIENPSILLIKN